MVSTGSSHGHALLLAIFLPQRAELSPFIHLSEFPGPALHPFLFFYTKIELIHEIGVKL